MVILGVDLGGTQIRAGLIENKLLKEVKTKATPSGQSKEMVLEEIALLIESFKGARITAVGIGVPSVVDVQQGIVYNATNIPSWDEVHLKDFLEKRLQIPVFVNNDANCFVAGEKHFGEGKNVSSLVGVTLGTGLGTGLIFNNKLYEGRNCGAGELCNLPYINRNYEYYCSGQYFNDELKVSGKEIASLAALGDAGALKMFDHFGYHLGKYLQAVVYAYDSELIILGGSISSSYTYFKESMLESINDGFLFPKSLENLKIEVSTLENSAIYGAASLALD